MSRSTVVWLPRHNEPDEHDLRDHTVRLTGSGLSDGGYLCLEYLVFPVPPILLGDHTWHEGDQAGLAIDNATVVAENSPVRPAVVIVRTRAVFGSAPSASSSR